MSEIAGLHGVVRGRTIELDDDLNAPDGTEVRVTVTLLPSKSNLELGDLPGFGSLANHGEELDAFEKWYREERRRGFEDAEPQ